MNWAMLGEAANYAVQSEMRDRGIVVHVKTNLGPSIKVFDAQQEKAQNAAGANLIKVGVSVRDKSGAELYSSGDWPETDYILTGAIVAIVGVGVLLIVRGTRTIKK